MSKFREYERPLLLTILIASVLANVAMTLRVKALRKPEPMRLEVGVRAPRLQVRQPDGSQLTLNFAHAREGTVLYFFSGESQWGSRNKDSVETLHSKVASRFRVIGLLPDTITPASARSGVGFPTYAVDSATRQAYKLESLPQTFVIDRGGIVRANWVGAFTTRLAPALEAFFAVNLETIAR